MKKNIKQNVLIVLLGLITTGCIDYYQITTKLNADGSLLRTVQVVGDSSSVFEGYIQLPTDTLIWNISTRWIEKENSKGETKKKLEYTATKSFNNVEDLNEYLSRLNNTAYIKREVRFNKIFRWFHSYIYFSETYKQIMPFHHADIEDYMSEEEYLLWAAGDDIIYDKASDKLVLINEIVDFPELTEKDKSRKNKLIEQLYKKFLDWLGRNLFEEYCKLALKELQVQFPNKYHILKRDKEKIYNKINVDIFEGDMLSMKVVAQSIGLSEDSIKRLNPAVFTDFYDQLETIEKIMLQDDKIKYGLEIPGTIISTNADKMQQNSLQWEQNRYRLFFAKDYTIYAKSTITNKWTFIVTGLLIVGLLLFIFKKRK